MRHTFHTATIIVANVSAPRAVPGNGYVRIRAGSAAHATAMKALGIKDPQEAKDTSKLAEAAVHRAAPFGDVSRLPKPWRFTETFLFNNDRKFKPRTLD